MAIQRGLNTRVALDFETTFGADPASPAALLMPVASCGLTGRVARLQPPEMYRGRRDTVAPLFGNTEVSGPIVVPMDDNLLGWWLKLAFGAPTTSGAVNFDHLFKVGATMPSAVIEKQFLDLGTPEYVKYNGVMVSRLSLRCAAGDGNNQTLALELIGSAEAAGMMKYDSDEAAGTIGNRFHHRHAAVTEGGSAYSYAPELELNVDFGLEAQEFYIGGGGAKTNILPGQVSVSGRLRGLFADWTLPAKGIAGTESAIVLTYTFGANNKLIIGLPEIMYGHPEIALEGPGGMFLDLPFEAYFGNASPDKSSVYFHLYNQVATY